MSALDDFPEGPKILLDLRSKVVDAIKENEDTEGGWVLFTVLRAALGESFIDDDAFISVLNEALGLLVSERVLERSHKPPRRYRIISDSASALSFERPVMSGLHTMAGIISPQ
jgi:hypothetical protein